MPWLSRITPTRTPVAVAAVTAGVLLSVGLAGLIQHADGARERERLERQADGAVAAVRQRISTYVALLRATEGLFVAGDEVTRAEFTDFIGAVELDHRYRGVQGIGYAAWLPTPADMAAADASLPDGARLWPEFEGPRSAIVLLEPMDRRNTAALGYDMFSEARRRAAMSAARQTGTIAATAPVILVQELDSVRQPGFLMYLPDYDVGADGQAVFRGWVYAPFRAHDFFAQAMADVPDGVFVEVRDAADPSTLLWPAETRAPPGPVISRDMPVGGRTWRLDVALEDSRPWSLSALLVLLGGLTLTGALAGAWRAQARALDQAERARHDSELLLKEVNHRAANSLQLVASFVYLQAQAIKDPAARAALIETRGRILAVARVHQRLYSEGAGEEVALKSYLVTVVQGLADAIEGAGRSLSLEAVEATVTADQAIALGVIVVELVGNAAKYAYAPGEPGEIRVRLDREGPHLRLSVEDDGPGFDPARKPKGSGLGMQVARAMARNLGGEIEVGRDGGGARVSVDFPG